MQDDGITLSEDQIAVVEAIVAGKAAWTERAAIEAKWPGVLGRLRELKIVAEWARPGRPVVVTLTPYGQWWAKREIVERRRSLREPAVDPETGRPDPRAGTETMPVGVPYWDHEGKPPRALRASWMPREVPLMFAADVPAPKKDEPELLMDPVSGRPFELFRGDGRSGIPIRIDRKIKPAKPKKRCKGARIRKEAMKPKPKKAG